MKTDLTYLRLFLIEYLLILMLILKGLTVKGSLNASGLLDGDKSKSLSLISLIT